MGNVCCKPPQDELILETFENNEGNNQALENTNKAKDKYPHDSDSAFKPRKLEELNVNPVINKIEEQKEEIENQNE